MFNSQKDRAWAHREEKRGSGKGCNWRPTITSKATRVGLWALRPNEFGAVIRSRYRTMSRSLAPAASRLTVGLHSEGNRGGPVSSLPWGGLMRFEIRLDHRLDQVTK